MIANEAIRAIERIGHHLTPLVGVGSRRFLPHRGAE